MSCLVDKSINTSNDHGLSSSQFTNLTGRFMQIRSYSTSDDENVNSILPPLWLDALEESGRLIKQLSELIIKLELAHEKRLLDVFGTDTKLGASVESLSKQIIKTFKRCQQALKDVCPLFASPGSSELLFCVNAKKTYNRNLDELSKRFKILQKNYISKINEKSKSGRDIELGQKNFTQTKDILDFDSNDMGVVTSSIDEIKARNYGLSEIVSSLQDIKELTLQIASMTIVQGTMLDRIDYNIMVSAEQTEIAAKALKKRVDDDSLALLIIRNLLFFITIITILLVVKFVRKARIKV